MKITTLKLVPAIFSGDVIKLKMDSSFRQKRLPFSSFSAGSFTLDSAKKTFLLSPQMILSENLGKYKQYLNFWITIIKIPRKRSELKKNSYGYYLHDEIDLTDAALLVWWI